MGGGEASAAGAGQKEAGLKAAITSANGSVVLKGTEPSSASDLSEFTFYHYFY